MLIPTQSKIYIATAPIDFRMSIDGLSSMIQRSVGSYIHDGSLYVFFNRHMNKIKVLYWDKNGFVLYYKRLDKTRFKFKKFSQAMETLTAEELDVLLAGYDPSHVQRKPVTLLGHSQ